MADTQTNGFSLDHPGPFSGPNPFGFASLDEAREALQGRFGAFDDSEMAELRGVVDTIDAFARLLDEAGQAAGFDLQPRDALTYLAGKLVHAKERIEHWHERTWQLSIIVEDQDLGALRTYPAFRNCEEA